MSASANTVNFLDEYLKLDEHGANLAERESVQIGKKRFRFKINGVVTVSPEMLKGEIGDIAMKIKGGEYLSLQEHPHAILKYPNLINIKYRKRRMGDKEIKLPRWLSQRWTPFIKDDPFGVPRIYEEYHMWYGGYYVDPFVASALSHWTFNKYVKPFSEDGEGGVPLREGRTQEKEKIAALEGARQGGTVVSFDNLDVASSFFGITKKEVGRLIRKEELVQHPSNGKTYLLQFELKDNKRTDEPRKAATSLEAVTETMVKIFGGDVPRDPSDADDAIPNPNYTLNIYNGERTSITAGEQQVRCEFIDYLKDVVQGSRPLPESLEKLEIKETENDPVRCSSALPNAIGDRLEKRLIKAANDSNTEEGRRELEKVQALIKKKNCNTLPHACTEEEILKIIQRATIEPQSSKSKPAKKKGKKRERRERESPPSDHDWGDLVGMDPNEALEQAFPPDFRISGTPASHAGRTPNQSPNFTIDRDDIDDLAASQLFSIARGLVGPPHGNAAGTSASDAARATPRVAGHTPARRTGATPARARATPQQVADDDNSDEEDAEWADRMLSFGRLRRGIRSSRPPSAMEFRAR